MGKFELLTFFKQIIDNKSSIETCNIQCFFSEMHFYVLGIL